MAAEAHVCPRLVTARMNHMASRADPSRARVRGQTGASKSEWEPSTGVRRVEGRMSGLCPAGAAQLGCAEARGID